MSSRGPTKSVSNKKDGNDATTACSTLSKSHSFKSERSAAVRRYIWDKFKDEDFEEEDDDFVPGCRKAALICLTGLRKDFARFLATMERHPRILFIAFIVFAFVSSCGLITMRYVSQHRKSDMIHRATHQATDNGQWFVAQFYRFLVSLHSLQQAVEQNPHFANLSGSIGERDVQGSAAGYIKYNTFFRNTTGICDDLELNLEFQKLVEGIKSSSIIGPDEEGIIASYQLAPHGVLCLTDPLADTQETRSEETDLFTDRRDTIGWDLLYEPSEPWHHTVRETIGAANRVSIHGPHDYFHNAEEVTPELFRGHLAVNIPGNKLVVDGKAYNSWGFIMVSMDFRKLVERSKIHERFAMQGMEFQMIWRERRQNITTGEEYETSNVLVESQVGHLLDSKNSIIVPFETPTGIWINRVGFATGFEPGWASLAGFVVVLLSIGSSILFSVTLVQRQLHRELLYEMLPRRALRKIQSGKAVAEKFPMVTTCFVDIVGYTTMAAEMRPMEVMKMLNELFVEVDKVADKHKIYKVETIGDAYMVTAGAPDACSGPEGAEKAALFALDVMELVKSYRTRSGAQLFIRAGMNSGPVVAGVVGTKRPHYTVFGDSVNSASRMESTSQKMKIQCTDSTCRLLRRAPSHTFDLVYRGSVDVKGKGKMDTWWINGATKGKSPTLERSHSIPVSSRSEKKKASELADMGGQQSNASVSFGGVREEHWREDRGDESRDLSDVTDLEEGLRGNRSGFHRRRSSWSLSTNQSAVIMDHADMTSQRSAMRREYYEDWLSRQGGIDDDKWMFQQKIQLATNSFENENVPPRRHSLDSIISMEIETTNMGSGVVQAAVSA